MAATGPLAAAAISVALGLALCMLCGPVVFYLVKKGYLKFYYWGVIKRRLEEAKIPRSL